MERKRYGMAEYQRQEMIRILKEIKGKSEKIIVTDPLEEILLFGTSSSGLCRYGKRGE
jgi:hypothetical protein